MTTTVQSALIIQPPDSLIDEIQRVRRAKDKAFLRWPPHINVLYPFISKETMSAPRWASLCAAISSLTPFELTLSEIQYFPQGDIANFHLVPSPDCQYAVQQLYYTAKSVFPECTDLESSGSYVPHMTLGQYPIHQAEDTKEMLQEIFSDNPIVMTCNKLDWITRGVGSLAKGEAPFSVFKSIEINCGMSSDVDTKTPLNINSSDEQKVAYVVNKFKKWYISLRSRKPPVPLPATVTALTHLIHSTFAKIRVQCPSADLSRDVEALNLVRGARRGGARGGSRGGRGGSRGAAIPAGLRGGYTGRGGASPPPSGDFDEKPKQILSYKDMVTRAAVWTKDNGRTCDAVTLSQASTVVDAEDVVAELIRSKMLEVNKDGTILSYEGLRAGTSEEVFFTREPTDVQPATLTDDLSLCLDPERKNMFFLEWRITDPKLIASLGEVQKALAAVGGKDFTVAQSCALDNLHITMNEVSLYTEEEITAFKDMLVEYQRNTLPSLLKSFSSTTVKFEGLDNFQNRVLFVPISGDGATILKRVYADIFTLLQSRSFRMKSAENFVPHITLGKSLKGNLPQSVHDTIQSKSFNVRKHGEVKIKEIVFCVKRKKEEPTPPVVYVMPC